MQLPTQRHALRGNLRSDSYKGITNIAYNHLNLPRLITFSTGNSIEIVYDAGGQKLRKMALLHESNSSWA